MERLLLRMVMMVRRPPSRQQVVLFAIVAAVSGTIVLLEWLEVWPHERRLPVGPIVRSVLH